MMNSPRGLSNRTKRGVEDPRGPAEREFSPAASLAFWCCLVFAAALFALLALAPRVRIYRELGREYADLHTRLVEQERQVEYLGQVADALEHDPHFAEELARVEFDAAGPEERIPVDPRLSLQGGRDRAPAAPPRAASPSAIGPSSARGLSPLLDRPFVDRALLDVLCDDRPVRSTLLGAAAFLVIVAFTLLCDPTGRPGERALEGRDPGLAARLARALAGRYAKRARPD
jgi:hypothetical protein